MRYLGLVFVAAMAFIAVIATPQPAIAQHSPALPSIGLPLPAIGLPPVRWERPQSPWWERQPPPPWERGHVARPVDRPQDRTEHRPRGNFPQVVYVMEPYVVEVPQPPQVIVIERPAETRIVEVEVPATNTQPYVPSGDRTVYIIPGCYVGNVPPKDVRLPAGCDPGKVTTYTP